MCISLKRAEYPSASVFCFQLSVGHIFVFCPLTFFHYSCERKCWNSLGKCIAYFGIAATKLEYKSFWDVCKGFEHFRKRCLFFFVYFHLQHLHCLYFFNLIFIVFFPLPFSPLHPPPTRNHHTDVHVHESFFLFVESLHPLTSPPTSCQPVLHLHCL